MLAGNRNAQCFECHGIEKNGEKSVRMEYLHEYASRLSLAEATQPNGTIGPLRLSFLNISPSNLCALSCRTCSPTGSRSWRASPTISPGLGPQHLLDPWLDQILKVLDDSQDLDRVSFCGGEPLLSVGHSRILEKLVQLGRTKTQVLYNTGLSGIREPEECYALWNQFDDVRVLVSCDATQDRFNFIRTGHSWDRLIQNLDHLRAHCPRVKTYAYLTYSLLNFYTLPEILTELLESGLFPIDRILFNLLYQPDHYLACNAPVTLKEKTREKYYSFMRSLLLKHDFKDALRLIFPMKMLLNYLNQTPSNPASFAEFLRLQHGFDHAGWGVRDFSSIFKEFSDAQD